MISIASSARSWPGFVPTFFSGTDLRHAALHLAFLARATRREEEGVSADFKVCDLLSQRSIGNFAIRIHLHIVACNSSEAATRQPGHAAAA